jgi:hypothetical protein
VDTVLKAHTEMKVRRNIFISILNL